VNGGPSAEGKSERPDREVKHVLAWSERESQRVGDQHTGEGQGAIEASENANHQQRSSRRRANGQQPHNGQPPDHVKGIVARIAGRNAQQI